jgi:acyl-ACP thioesterase
VPPSQARTVTASRSVRLADMDAGGRVRLDALARFLQDVAIDDVAETGWGVPEHLWFVRRIRVSIVVPLLRDRTLRLRTWCSGVGSIAAGRRWSVEGDAGGRVEVDSVWIHLDAAGRPARIGDFGPYAAAAGGRAVSTRFELPELPATAPRVAWQLRGADVDLHGHVNNAVHWAAVEDAVSASGAVDLRAPLRADLEYREPLDLGDELSVSATTEGDRVLVGLRVGETVCAVARLIAPTA